MVYKTVGNIVLAFFLLCASALAANPSLPMVGKPNAPVLTPFRGNSSTSGYQHQSTVNTPVYKQSTGTIAEGYLGHPANLYARRMNATGFVSVWINYSSNGRTYQADGPEATRLINLYKHNALSHL
ncbi:MAG: hypothetical protein IBX45_07800 [Campylobacterales bacterium]|nr:hypothetical protein [Campylobacterales bacterium]